MDALELAKMRQDRRKHSVATIQAPRPSAAAPKQNPNRPSTPRPAAAAPDQTLRRPQTIRFTLPSFNAARASTASTGVASTSRRADSLIAPNANTSPPRDKSRRKSTAASLFQSRSWSMFWDPRFRAATCDGPPDSEDNSTASAAEVEEAGAEPKVKRSFLWRCKHDRLMHVVLGMVLLVGSSLIVAGVAWTVTHETRVLEDKRDFVCGKGIAGGPKCAVHLKGEKSDVGTADWVGGEVVDWWLKNHCVWRGKETEWWCGAEIGVKEGEEDQVLPQGTWFEKTEEEEPGPEEA